MTGKLVEDLLISGGTTPGVYYSSAIPLGDDNGAMAELWVTSVDTTFSTLGSVVVTAEGSNDGINFDSSGVATATLSTAPGWNAGPGTPPAVIPWAWLRLRIEITGATGTVTALVSASIRTFRAG